jgi:ABC-2 type transport system permease protein
MSEDSQVIDGGAVGPAPLAGGVPFSALEALFRLSASRLLRGRRLLILGLLFSAPLVFALLARRFQEPYRAAETEKILVFGLVPQALLPLAALLFASGMIQDDVEEQTLTYLLIRPIPRWLIYLVKLAATWLVASLVSAVFTAAALAAVYWGTGELSPAELARRTAVFCGLLSLSLLSYTSLFGLLSLAIRRSLVLGVAYILVFEGVLANIDFAVRGLTVMYYVRTLSIRWLGLDGRDWSIDPARAPGAGECLTTLVATALVFSLLGGWLFSSREFRVKTPEGS